MDGREARRGWAGWLGSLSRELDQGEAEWLDRIAHQVLDRASLCRGDTVADLGAGTGLLSLKAAREVGPNGRVYAVDSSQECLDALLSSAIAMDLDNITACLGLLEALPLESSCCTTAVSRSALVYANDLGAALAEMKRVLQPGGRFSVFEPLPREIEVVAIGEGQQIDEDFLLMERTLKEKRTSYSLDREMLRGAFEAAGFEDLMSLPLHFTVTMGGRSEEDIRDEYLWDLPGELAAFSVLRSVFDEERVLGSAAWFAHAASKGRAAVRVPALLVWGARP